MPIYRATPWLSAEQMGTTGSFTRPGSWNGGLGPLVVADEQGKPNYDNINFPGDSIDKESYLDGTSLGSADSDWYVNAPLQNNFPDDNAGYYGAASDTTPFDNDDDQSTEPKTTEVTLRYTIELQRPNLSQLGYDTKQEAADAIDGIRASDIDDGNSRLVMEGEDGYQSFDSYSDGAGIPYNVLQNNTSHPGIIVTTATLNVDVTNETSDSGVEGDTNGDAS